MFVCHGRAKKYIIIIIAMCFILHVHTSIVESVYTCITPQKHAPKTHTHSYTLGLKKKKQEVWIMLALVDGRAKKIHLETIEDTAQEQRKVSARGEDSPPFGEQLSSSLLS